MGTKIVRGPGVTRPTVAPLVSSVLDHADVEDVSENESFGLVNNAGLWVSYNCLDLLVPTPMCPDPLGTTYKTFRNADWVPGFEFAVQGGVQCNMVGLDQADQQAEVKRVFAASEGRGVEQALLLNRFTAKPQESGDRDDDGYWDAPVDLGAAPSLGAGIAILESYAAANYIGVPTLHMPRGLVTMAAGAGQIAEDSDKFFTKSGSKVAAGGGYDNPDAAMIGTVEMFVTGEVFVQRSEQINVHTYTAPGDGSGIGSDQNGLASNTAITLAERMYRVGIDCLLAKVTVTVWGDPVAPVTGGGGFGN